MGMNSPSSNSAVTNAGTDADPYAKTSQNTDVNTSAQSLVDKLIREELKTLAPYESARRLFSMSGTADNNENPATMWLNANENPYSPQVKADPSLYNRYPDFQPEPLIEAYADYAGVSTEQVLATRGADEGIELLIRTFCAPNQNIVICPPTYGMYAISAETANVNVLTAPLQRDMQLDVENVLSKGADAQIVFICSPNNPTGDVIRTDALEQVLESLSNQAIVVADEAYIEFCADASVSNLLDKYDNLVILRTLSKAFALAGLRCGFTLASKQIIDALKKVIAPYPIPAPVAQMATQALSADGLNWMRDKVAELNQRRDSFISKASNWKIVETVYPSKTNFVLLKLKPSLSATDIMQTFVNENILLRNQSKQLMLDNTLRVTIGNEAEMNAVEALFAKLEQQLNKI